MNDFTLFREFIRTKCQYETVYEDSEGVPILIIRELSAFSMVNKLIDFERKKCAQMVERMGIEGYGTLAIAAAIRKGDQDASA
jgi:hypothetical protein